MDNKHTAILVAGVAALAGIAVGYFLGAKKTGPLTESEEKKNKSPLRVLVTGAAGQIGYALVPLIAVGDMFGKDQEVIIHMLDIPVCKDKLVGMAMELEDALYPLLKGVVATTDLKEAFMNVDVAVLVGGFPRLKDMQRRDLLAKNNPIFVGHGKALSEYAKKDCKILVVANPANSNCYTAYRNCPGIPKENFTCLTRLDLNRAKAQLGNRLAKAPQDLQNLIIWGNHSATQVPDPSHGYYVDHATQKKVQVAPLLDEKFVRGDFMPVVQQRGKKVIELRGASSALSAAQAICDHIQSWLVTGTKAGEHVSMGVVSDGSYGVTPGLVFSYPVTCSNGRWKIVQGLHLDDFTKAAIKATEKELCDERDELASLSSS